MFALVAFLAGTSFLYAQTWEFNTRGDTEGWSTRAGTNTITVQATSINGTDGVLTLQDAVSNNDPILIVENIELDRTTYSAWDSVEIRLRQLDASGSASQAWNAGGTYFMASPGGVNMGLITDNDTWSVAEQSDNWVIIKADISYLNDGAISTLRFDPIGGDAGIGKNIEIDYIRLSAKELILPPSLDDVTMGTDSMNVIFILIDDMGWKDLGCYGSDFFESPKIDEFANTATLFTDAYAASPICSPTRASILSGLTPGRLGFFVAAGHVADEVLQASERTSAQPWYRTAMPQTVTRLSNDYITFAEVFKALDYSTAFMGKWHLGREPYFPENQGFDLVVGGREHSGPPGPGKYFAPWDVSTLPVVPEGTHICDVLTDTAISYITEKKDEPFMLCLWYYDVHAPFQSKEDLKSKYEDKLTDDHIQRSPTMGGMIENMDTNIGRLMQTIEDLNLDENTIVILTSDNGGNMYNSIDGEIPTNNYPLRGCKGNNHEGGVRVPLIVRVPGVTNPNTQSNVVSSTYDHYPTLLELLDITIPEEITLDGQSFVNALKGEDYDRAPIYSAFLSNTPATGNIGNMWVRDGDWKLYKFYYESNEGDHHYELFNLKDDLSERNNLADVMPEKVTELSALIEARIIEADIKEPQPNTNFAGNSADVWNGSRSTEISILDNAIHIISSGVEPSVETVYVPKVSPGTYNVNFKIRSTATGGGKMSWTTSASTSYNEQNSVSFDVVHDGQWHSYSLPIPLNSTMKKLRFQPADSEGEIELRDIEMTTLKGHYIREWPLTYSSIQLQVSSEGNVNIIEGVGETLQLFAKNTSGEDVSVVWSVDYDSLATIDAFGLLTTVSGGMVTITAKAIDGSGTFVIFDLKVIEPSYNLIVTSGAGDGSYTEGTKISITADAPPSADHVFDQWTGDVANVANVNDDTTTITMPAADATVTATYALAYNDGNILRNAGFETPVVSSYKSAPFTEGWIFSNVSGVQRNGSPWGAEDAPEGMQTCFLQWGGASISQTFNVDTSGYYLLKCQMARGDTKEQPVELYLDGASVNTFTPESSTFAEVGGTYFLDIGEHSIEFKSTAAKSLSTFIDDVYFGLQEAVMTYTLTVNSGTGGGSYIEGTEVSIIADAPTSGNVFDQWTGDVAYVANVNDDTTTITMPAVVVQLTATYKEDPTSTFQSVETEMFRVYPNPSGNGEDIRIELAQESEISNATVSITDLTGKLVYSEKLMGQKAISISTAQFNKGIYLLCIEALNSKKYMRVIFE